MDRINTTAKRVNILLIEEDYKLALKIEAALEEAGYQVVKANSALDGLKRLYESYPDLVILARELPMLHGEEPCLRIRQASYLPIIVLGSQNEAAGILELGADAFMVKPPDPNELVARVHSLLRRKLEDDPPGGNPIIGKNRSTKKVRSSSKLTTTEFRVASCLMRNKGRLLGYYQLIAEVWGGKMVSTDTLHFFIRKLQQKLTGARIFSLRGVGYYLSDVTK
ncbi:MAG: response regulator transcription factor [Chloroflexota bacterium]